MDLNKLALDLNAFAHEARSVEEMRLKALEALALIAPTDTAVFAPLQADEWPFVSKGLSASDRKLVVECEQSIGRYMGDVKQAFDIGIRTGGYINTEVYTVAERNELPIFREILSKQHISCEAGLFPMWRGQSLGFIRLSRHGRASHIRSRELERAVRLLPTISLTLHAVCTLSLPLEPSAAELSSREWEIARYVSCGLTTPEIARLLGTSRWTVRNQLTNIYRKLHVSGRAELSAWVARSSRS